MASNEGTKQEALELLLKLADERRRATDDERLSEVASDELVRAVFEAAWTHQWERDNKAFSREVEPLVDEAVNRAVNSVED